MELIKQNQDFKSISGATKRKSKFTKATYTVKDGSKTINNTTNNNQKFNLNFFLNTTCKDAMNMSEFIENINIEFQDIENIGKNGYVAHDRYDYIANKRYGSNEETITLTD